MLRMPTTNFIEKDGFSFVNVGFLLRGLSVRWFGLRKSLRLENERYRLETDEMETIPKAVEYSHTEKVKRTEIEIETVNKIYSDLYELWKHRR